MARNIWKEPHSTPPHLSIFTDEEFWELHERFSGSEEKTTTKEKKLCSKQTETHSFQKKPGKL